MRLTDTELAWAKRAGKSLAAGRGRSLLTVGGTAPAAIHALALQVNRALGNVGKTCEIAPSLEFVAGPGETFVDLVRDIEGRRVSALFVLGANPVYAAPGDIDFAKIYAKVPVRVHAGLHVDETAAVSNWHVPLPHALEDWSDARSPDGLATIIQPVVQPLYDSRSIHSLVAALTSDAAPSALALVRQTWGGQLADDAAWANALKTGFVETAAPAPPAIAPAATSASHLEPRPGEVEIVIRPDPTIHDGSFANNGWLQELPKPLFKTTWENVVAVSPSLAAELAIDSGDVVRVASGGRAIEGPAWVLAGQPGRVVTLFLGYGRTRGGRIGTGIGYDAYRLRTVASPWSTIGTVKPTGGHVELATTQDHHLLDAEGANLVRTVTPAHPSAAIESDREQDSFYKPWPEDKPAWGMVIDLDRCIGCNACVTACQAENNVPVVGKDQVHRGREMHWLRVDRYYAGEPDDPQTYFQPVPCMHCEQAPCEMGCPVHATVHSPEGLNLMVYNRCIGTRTCSSYCPYKVRRFNWFDYTSDAPRPTEAQRNPDVTVRGRGVMEKCTYCIQRIEGATVQADIENRPVRDGEVMTACQQACPAKAISFGNLADTDSEVRSSASSTRNYALLAELGTRPRTTYLARNRVGDEGRWRVMTRALPLDSRSGDITTEVGRIPLRFPARIPWLIALILSLALLSLFLASITWLFARGVGVWGLNIPVNWAFAIHLYVWWLGTWARRNPDLRDAAADGAGLAQQPQPVRRGDDGVCGDLRGDGADHPSRPPVVPLLDVPLSGDHGRVAAVPKPARMGRVGGAHLPDRLDPLLVHRAGPGPRDGARPRPEARLAGVFRHLRPRLARLGAALGGVAEDLSDDRGDRRAAGRLGAQRSVAAVRLGADPRLALDDFPALFRARRSLLRLRHGRDDRDRHAPHLRARRTSSPSATSACSPRSCSRWGG